MKARARRNVTVTIANRNPTMPRPRLGALPMTAAERQARRRAKLRRLGDTLTRAPVPRGLHRPRRWAAAVTALMALQDEYRAWLDRPRGIKDRGQAASDHRARPRRAARR